MMTENGNQHNIDISLKCPATVVVVNSSSDSGSGSGSDRIDVIDIFEIAFSLNDITNCFFFFYPQLILNKKKKKNANLLSERISLTDSHSLPSDLTIILHQFFFHFFFFVSDDLNFALFFIFMCFCVNRQRRVL